MSLATTDVLNSFIELLRHYLKNPDSKTSEKILVQNKHFYTCHLSLRVLTLWLEAKRISEKKKEAKYHPHKLFLLLPS